MCLFVLWLLPDSHYRGVICSNGLAGKPRPLWVFQKLSNQSPATHTANMLNAEALMREKYNSIWSLAGENLHFFSIAGKKKRVNPALQDS